MHHDFSSKALWRSTHFVHTLSRSDPSYASVEATHMAVDAGFPLTGKPVVAVMTFLRAYSATTARG